MPKIEHRAAHSEEVNWAPDVMAAGTPNLSIQLQNSACAVLCTGGCRLGLKGDGLSPPGGSVNYIEQVGESLIGRQWADQVDVHVAETSGRDRDVLWTCLSILPCWQVRQALAMAATSVAAHFQTNLARMRRLEACLPGWMLLWMVSKTCFLKIEGLLA